MNSSGSIKDYSTAIRWIYDRIDYERIRPQRNSTHFRLERMQRLLAAIGSPQQRIPAVQIAGTKGKGSTAAMLQSIMTAAGQTTGLFTSPHIHKFEERIQVDGRSPTPDQMVSMVNQLSEQLRDVDEDLQINGPTYFEVATLLAWIFFSDCNVDLAVLETGLGGRLDCTTVCKPRLTIITNIGLDHTEILGETHAAIAAEKAGIMKAGVPLLSWVDHPEAFAVIEKFAERLHCRILQGDRDIVVSNEDPTFSVASEFGNVVDLQIPLAGSHQRKNAALATTAALMLQHGKTDEIHAAIRLGLNRVSWPLRFEFVAQQPCIVLDAAHNPDSAAALVQTLTDAADRLPGQRILIFSSSRDKDFAGMLQHLLPLFDAVIVTEYQLNPRAASVSELQQKILTIRPEIQVICQADPVAALQQAKSLVGLSGTILGTGSIFLAAELRSHLIKE